MISATIIGTGNVAMNLCEAFKLCGSVLLKQVIGRNPKVLENFQAYAKTSTDFKMILDSDVCVIAVSDDSITSISKHFTNYNGLLIHTSGSVAVHALPKECRKGVFYPLQTFSNGRTIDFNKVPICIEAEEEVDFELLKNLAESISRSVFKISSEQRRSLHLAAVFVNNFTNHLYEVGQHICRENNVPFELLKPLILETAKKMESLSPNKAQTGPARRRDKKTIDGHLEQLKNKKQKEIYKSLTESITETPYGKKL